jgi:phage internal scaffolding protein
MKKVFVRDPFNYDVDAASVASGVSCPELSLAQQHMAEDTDINKIVERFGVTGQLPVVDRMPLPDDYVGITDYQSAMNAVRRGQEAFESLRPEIRARFDNDPGAFVDFALDPKNLDQMREMGLAPAKIQEMVAPTPQGGPEGAAQ